MPVYVICLGNVYGYSKSMRFDAVINRFIFDANFKNRIRVHGNGTQCRSFLHIKHAAEFLCELTNTKSISPGIYNLVDEIASVNDIAGALREIYPELEMIFVNQHLKLRDLKVKPDEKINAAFTEKILLPSALKSFAEAFTF